MYRLKKNTLFVAANYNSYDNKQSAKSDSFFIPI